MLPVKTLESLMLCHVLHAGIPRANTTGTTQTASPSELQNLQQQTQTLMFQDIASSTRRKSFKKATNNAYDKGPFCSLSDN